MRIRRRGAPGHHADRTHHPARQDAGIGRRIERVNDLLHRHDHLARGQRGLFLHAQNAPQQHIAAAVGLLRVDHGDIRIDRRRGRQGLPGVGALQETDAVVDLGQVRAHIAAQHGERQARRAGHIRVGHVRVAVFAQLQRRRPAVFHRIAQPVQRAHARIAAPGKAQRRRAAGTDQLVVNQVRGHPHQPQVAFALADHLVAGGVRDQVGKAFHCHAIAICDQLCHGLGQGNDVGHSRLLHTTVSPR